MNNMKAYISTFCTVTSYGSILQAYALKKYLAKMGVSSEIISERSKNDITRFTHSPKLSSLKSIIVALHNKINEDRIASCYQNNLSFIENNIDFFEYSSYDELINKQYESSIFISGSDQVFNPIRCDPAFFLDFAPKGSKRISYAASMGSLNIPEEKKIQFAGMLNNFDYLSFREKDAADLANEYIDKGIQVHVDPTFLLDADEWTKIEKEYPINGKYILFYPLFWDRKLNKQLKELHKITGLPIICVGNPLGKYHQKVLLDAGVEQFLWLINHAEYVITSSFHGAALSINFNKKVSIVVNPNKPSRLNCLSKTLDYPIVPINEIDKIDIDYEHINRKIECEKNKSAAYLNEVIYGE